MRVSRFRARHGDRAALKRHRPDERGHFHVVIADLIVKALDDADLAFPKLTPKQRQELLQARRQLLRDR
jgi:hypothetical protein